MGLDNFLLAENILKHLNTSHRINPNPVDLGRQIFVDTGDFCFSEVGLRGVCRLGSLLALNSVKTHDPEAHMNNEKGNDSIDHNLFL